VDGFHSTVAYGKAIVCEVAPRFSLLGSVKYYILEHEAPAVVPGLSISLLRLAAKCMYCIPLHGDTEMYAKWSYYKQRVARYIILAQTSYL